LREWSWTRYEKVEEGKRYYDNFCPISRSSCDEGGRMILQYATKKEARRE
jgi:hypothetical protein